MAWKVMVRTTVNTRSDCSSPSVPYVTMSSNLLNRFQGLLHTLRRLKENIGFITVTSRMRCPIRQPDKLSINRHTTFGSLLLLLRRYLLPLRNPYFDQMIMDQLPARDIFAVSVFLLLEKHRYMMLLTLQSISVAAFSCRLSALGWNQYERALLPTCPNFLTRRLNTLKF